LDGQNADGITGAIIAGVIQSNVPGLSLREQTDKKENGPSKEHSLDESELVEEKEFAVLFKNQREQIQFGCNFSKNLNRQDARP
jgi:hypothetical protein